jgi:aspartate aminotransferase
MKNLSSSDPDSYISTRMKGIEMSGIRKMFDLASKDAIHLGLGEPDFEPPEVAIDALDDAVRSGKNNYGPSAGIPELREAIAEEYCQHRDGTTMENVIITNSGSEALMSAALTFFDAGDEVLVPDPGFVLYKPQVQLCKAVPVSYALHREYNFVPQLDDLENLVTARTKAIIINSPSNPTGAVYNKYDVKDLLNFASDHELLVISDEVYDHMVYDDKHHSFLSDYDNVVVINSFSKRFAMTGWRLGYMVASTKWARELVIAHYHMVACPPTPFQWAALAAVKDSNGFEAMMREEFKARRDLIVGRLNRMDGVECELPKGAFYAYPYFDFHIKADELAMTCARNNLICTPGTAFGNMGKGHMRFSYANSQENIEKGMDIFERVVEDLL